MCDVFNRLNAIPPHAPCHSPHALKGRVFKIRLKSDAFIP